MPSNINKVVIGDAVLYHANCMDVLPMLDKVDAVVTDPPYGIGFKYEGYSDTRENLISLISKIIPAINKLTGRSYILCGPTQIGLYPQPEWVCCITWDTTGSFGKYGYNQWTPVLCYGKDLDGFGNINGVTKTDTFRISGGAGVGFQRKEEEKRHTCPKPINMMEIVVNRFSLLSDTILDPFMGSGTTGVAALKLGRKFIGIEIERKYFDIAVERISKEAKLMDETQMSDREQKLNFIATYIRRRHVGWRNAVAMRVIAKAAGLTPSLLKADRHNPKAGYIPELRERGVPILSCNKGYYWPRPESDPDGRTEDFRKNASRVPGKNKMHDAAKGRRAKQHAGELSLFDD